jgi:hypothetical protein
VSGGQTYTEQAADEEWISIRKQTPSASKEDVVSISCREGAKFGRASVCFRHAAADFMEGYDSIDIDVGGQNLNLLRVTRQKKAKGEFKLAYPGRQNGGTRTPRAMFAVEVWPNETRSRPATYKIVGDRLVATLPDDWAKPLEAIRDKQPYRAGLPKVAEAQEQAARSRVTTDQTPPLRRSPNAIPLAGEPPPGRSALDMRNKSGGR